MTLCNEIPPNDENFMVCAWTNFWFELQLSLRQYTAFSSRENLCHCVIILPSVPTNTYFTASLHCLQCPRTLISLRHYTAFSAHVHLFHCVTILPSVPTNTYFTASLNCLQCPRTLISLRHYTAFITSDFLFHCVISIRRSSRRSSQDRWQSPFPARSCLRLFMQHSFTTFRERGKTG